MSDTYARVMRPADEPGKRRATRSGTGRRPGTGPGLAAAPAPAEGAAAERAPAEDQERPASPPEGTFAAAAAAFLAGRDAQTGPGFSFEDVPAPKRLAPFASA